MPKKRRPASLDTTKLTKSLLLSTISTVAFTRRLFPESNFKDSKSPMVTESNGSNITFKTLERGHSHQADNLLDHLVCILWKYHGLNIYTGKWCLWCHGQSISEVADSRDLPWSTSADLYAGNVHFRLLLSSTGSRNFCGNDICAKEENPLSCSSRSMLPTDYPTNHICRSASFSIARKVLPYAQTTHGWRNHPIWVLIMRIPGGFGEWLFAIFPQFRHAGSYSLKPY